MCVCLLTKRCNLKPTGKINSISYIQQVSNTILTSIQMKHNDSLKYVYSREKCKVHKM